jgi:hypothetical protein
VIRGRQVVAIAGAVVAAAVVLGLGYEVASQRPSPMEQRDVARIGERIVSLSAEMVLLAEALLADRITENFARAHLEHLEQEVHDQESELDRPAPPGLDVQPLREARKRLQDQLTETKRHMSEASVLARIRADVARIHDDARSATPPK